MTGNSAGNALEFGPTTTEIENAETNATAAAASASAASTSASEAASSASSAAASAASVETGLTGSNLVPAWARGSAAYVMVGDSEGELPLLGASGRLDASLVPALIDEDDFASDSDTQAPTQQSVKAFAENLTGGLQVIAEGYFDGTGSTGAKATDYVGFKIIIATAVPETDATYLYMRVSEDGGSTWESGASDYHWFNGYSGGTYNSVDATAAFMRTSAEQWGANGNENFAGEIVCFNPADTTKSKMFSFDITGFDSGAGLINAHGKGSYIGTNNAVNGFQLYMSSGNINGEFVLFGLRK